MDLLFVDFLGKPVWSWIGFLLLVLALLIFDLGVLQRKPHGIGVRESLMLSAFYISIGLLFSLWVWYFLGQPSALQYLTGFVVEKSLALDNIFVIAMIFGYFGVPRAYQHRVLVYGIIGVVILRGIMIGLGAAVVARFVVKWSCFLGQVYGFAKLRPVYVHAAFRISACPKYAMSGVPFSRAV
ncbi:TerC family protein [Falsihalocynthiibacter arcticus]|uniref:Tellurium resistance protein TerC n=1 Tax=Falsihalocynthiibacter arcticus TaxID=1579316 RepID=A0A126V433_9RHOB|nr:hypothetical protein [Falsihalocynthiibacter arcticus]AML53074.1 hypothetical protein RC74_19045 [Falsihalocynthiibacter arcticus]